MVPKGAQTRFRRLDSPWGDVIMNSQVWAASALRASPAHQSRAGAGGAVPPPTRTQTDMKPLMAGLILLTCATLRAAAPVSPDDWWNERLEPVLDRYCFKCHGGVRQKGGLDLRSVDNLLAGGEHAPEVIPGNASSSRLLQYVLKGADPHMPLDEKKQLTEAEIGAFRGWIDSLPKSKTLTSIPPGKPGWAAGYLSALRASQKPSWTPPPGLPASEVIDQFIRLDWRRFHARPTGVCDDGTFVRRVYLDLAGRVPTASEAEGFLRSNARGKRAVLVDALLAGPEYPVRMREVFDVVLMGRADAQEENRRRDHQWFAFLERAFEQNHGWDRIVRQLISARPESPADRGAEWYLYGRKNNYQAMAEAVAPMAFGLQIGCAQCHNHPLTAEVGQRHYWGLVAAFNRSKNVDATGGVAVGESAVGGFINFSNLKKESQPAELAFLSGRTISEKRPADGEKETDAPELYLVPPPKDKQKPVEAARPKFSRREALADAATRDNPRLAPAFVNRVWDMLLGRGLVNPVDDLAARHRPNHPDLLGWLARDFEKSGYDIKRLVREIVLSRTYQLDSGPAKGPPASPDAFARGLEKPLSGEQIYRSFLIATGNKPGPDGKICGRSESEIRRAFTTRFPDLFPENYSPSLQQAMFISNSPILDDLLKPGGDNTAARVAGAKRREQSVELAFQAVLGRNPDSDERRRCAEFLRNRGPADGPRELLWALIAGPEFQVNH